MSQDFDCFSNLNDYLEGDSDEMLIDSTNPHDTISDSENSLLDSPIDSPATQNLVKKVNKQASTPITPKEASFNLSDVEKLQTEYEQIIGVPAKRVRGSKSSNHSMEALATPLSKAAQKKADAAAKRASKPMTAAAQRKADAIKDKLLENLLAKSLAPTLPEPPPEVRTRAAQKKLLAEQKRVEHEAFLLEAFGIAEPTTSTRSGANSKQIRAMLNGLFGSKDCGESVPPSSRPRRQQRKSGVEVIDLVSSPILEVPGVVSLDSDDDDPVVVEANDKATAIADSSFDADNYEISVKIRWQDKVIKEKMRKYQRFEDLMSLLAKRESASPELVVLNMDDRIIQASDTPDSIGYNISQFLTGRIVTRQIPGSSSPSKGKKKAKNANILKIKIQIESRKKPLTLDIEKTQPMKLAFIKLSEELKCKPEQIRLRFDGEKVDLTSMPEDLDFEGGEILDCRIAD